jgi:hypothetical protein
MVVKVRILTAEGRPIEMRMRSNRRIAFPTADLPSPLPKRIALACAGERLEAGLTSVQFGYAVYYMPAGDWNRLMDFISHYKPNGIWQELMRDVLPCVLHYFPSP